MTRTAPPGRRTGIEMTNDAHFAERIRRLTAVSAVALAATWLLALTTADAGWGAVALLMAGWIAMPIVLAASLDRPRLRYLLVLPASFVTSGVLVTALSHDGAFLAGLGWWLMSAGVWLGAGLGGWFWFRWVAVPAPFEHPFSAARWSLITVHATLIVLGAVFVIVAAAL